MLDVVAATSSGAWTAPSLEKHEPLLRTATDTEIYRPSNEFDFNQQLEVAKRKSALPDEDGSGSSSPRGFTDLEYKGTNLQDQIELRVAHLLDMAHADDEPFNLKSAQDLFRFKASMQFSKRPSVFLVDNGNLRMVWKGPGGAHLGLQFLGNGLVQFVIFAPRQTDVLARVAGRDSFDGILRQIEAFDLRHLIEG